MIPANSSIHKIRYYFSFFIASLYLAVGITFLFTDIAIQTFPAYRGAVGGLLCLYAIYRAYMAYKKEKQRMEEE